MNNRIKELKLQASLWCDQHIPEKYSEETNSYGSAWDDKFAELIVRECVSMAKGFEFAIEQNGFMNPSRYGLSKSMQEHFGIEE